MQTTFIQHPYGSIRKGWFTVDAMQDGKQLYRAHSAESHEDAEEYAKLQIAALNHQTAVFNAIYGSLSKGVA